MTTNRVRVAAVAALAATMALGGCKKSAPAPVERAPLAVAAPAALAKSHSVIADAKALDRLPKGTLALAVFGNPADLVARLGRAEVAEALGTTWVKAVAASTLMIGANLLDPAGWGSIGVDTAAPVGIAWLGARDETAVVFVTLKDPAAFRSFVDGLAAKEHDALVAEEVGGVTLLRAGREDDGALVLGKEAAWLVISDGGGGAALRHARAIATLENKADSLAADPRFRSMAVEKLEFGKDAAAWVDVQAVIAAIREASQRPLGGDEPDYLQQELDDAKASGDTERLERAKAALEREQSWRAERAKLREAENAAIEQLFGGIDGLAVGAEIDGGAIRLRAVAPLRAGTLLARGLHNSPGALPLERVLGQRPLVMLGGTVDPAVALEATALVASADGGDIEEIFDLARSELGVDTRGALVPALDGRVGIAMTADLDAVRAAKDDDVERLFGGALVLGLSEPAKMRGILDALWKQPVVQGHVTVDADSGRATMHPAHWRDIHVAVVGDVLVITTDRGDLDRAAGTGKGAIAEGGGVVAEVAGAEGGAIVGLYDHRILGWLLGSIRFDFGDQEVEPGESDSPERKQKIAAYQAARKRADALRDKREDVQMRAIMDVTRSIGVLVAEGRVDGAAIVATGALVTGHGSVAEASGSIAKVTLVSVQQGDAIREELWKAEDEARAIRDELRRDALRAPAPEEILVPKDPSD